TRASRTRSPTGCPRPTPSAGTHSAGPRPPAPTAPTDGRRRGPQSGWAIRGPPGTPAGSLHATRRPDRAPPGVVGFERAEREVLGAVVERVRAEGTGHADEVSGVAARAVARKPGRWDPVAGVPLGLVDVFVEQPGALDVWEEALAVAVPRR